MSLNRTKSKLLTFMHTGRKGCRQAHHVTRVALLDHYAMTNDLLTISIYSDTIYNYICEDANI